MPDGTIYAVPFIATAHGIYYNQDIFAALGLDIPDTWETLIETAARIQHAGYIPFANTTGATWTAAELIFMNLAPNFIGGRQGRMAYINGQRCFDDPRSRPPSRPSPIWHHTCPPDTIRFLTPKACNSSSRARPPCTWAAHGKSPPLNTLHRPSAGQYSHHHPPPDTPVI